MNDRDTDKSAFLAQARGYYRKAGRNAAAYVDDARGWSATHLPGGARTMWIALGLVLLGLVLWLLWPSKNAGEQAGRMGFGGPTPVGVAKAVRGDMAVTLNALGTVTPLATVTVTPQVSGQLLHLNFQEGETVKAGDLLAEIDPRPFQAALDQAKGQLERDQALLANAIIDLSRYRMLFAQNATSQQILDTQAALVRQDQGTVKSDEGNVSAAEVNLGYTHVSAPVSGRVGLRKVDIGNYITAGNATGIVVITQEQPISVVFSLPEDNIGNIAARVAAGATLSVDAFDRGRTQKLATGRLSTLDNQIDTTTGTVKLRAMFDNSNGRLFPNQFVNVTLLVNTLHNQVVVPVAAIQRGSHGSFVYVVQPDSTVAMRAVTTGESVDQRVAILNGLRPGETVVVDGADRLRDGADVILPNAKGLPKSSASASASGTRHGGRFMRLLQRLPADQREKLMKMSPEERRDWFRSHRGELRGGGPQ